MSKTSLNTDSERNIVRRVFNQRRATPHVLKNKKPNIKILRMINIYKKHVLEISNYFSINLRESVSLNSFTIFG